MDLQRLKFGFMGMILFLTITGAFAERTGYLEAASNVDRDIERSSANGNWYNFPDADVMLASAKVTLKDAPPLPNYFENVKQRGL